VNRTITTQAGWNRAALKKPLAGSDRLEQSVSQRVLMSGMSGPLDSTTLAPYRGLASETALELANLPLGVLSCLPQSIERRFEECQSLNGRFQLSTRTWELRYADQPTALVRMVLIEGTSNEIINTWIFPYCAAETPVFAAELIAMSHAPRLTFMDIQVPALKSQFQARAAECSRPVREEFADLLIAEQPPEWAIDATQGNYLFSRAASSTTFPRINAAYMNLLRRYLQYLQAAPRPTATAAECKHAQQALHAYQLHHLHHSPGGNFLAKVFGTEWTYDFLHSFLFTLPQGASHVQSTS
jgi:hypothetical protein